METIDFRPPALSAASEAQAIVQLQRYLYQLGEQLNYALGTLHQEADTISQSAQQNAEAIQKVASTSPRQTFTGLKDLIIKSADIVNAYYDQISTRLEGMYVAESTFGTFRQEVAADLTANAEGIQQAFSNIQKIDSNVAEIGSSLQAVNAYIKTGVLYYNSESMPVYGVEIGQRNEIDGVIGFQKYSRFTANRLAFFDQNDNEVAYITDRVLHITIAEIQTLTASTANIDRILMGDYILSAGGDGHLTIH